MKTFKLLPAFVLFMACYFVLLTFATGQAYAQETKSSQNSNSISVDELLEKVKHGHRADQVINQERLNTFNQNKQQQSQLLEDAKNTRQAAEALSLQREQTFEDNEQQITLLKERLTERLGSLKELFGVLQLVANDAQGQFDNSLVQIHYPDRSARLNAFSEKMGQVTELPSVQEIEALWFELQREMTESGKIVKSKQPVLLQSGQEVTTDVIRVGTFNLVSDQKYFQRIAETGRIVEYPRQPSSRYMQGAESLADNHGSVIPMTIDPIRGQLIALMGTAPQLTERVQQGGVIGYVIVVLGALVVALAIGRFLYLVYLDNRIQNQLNHLSKPGNNPLGRIIQAYEDNKSENLDHLEIKLGEAVLREVPPINRGLSFLKISAAVAPLLGLLGTVTGMIITFQAITLFGAGDPKLMAGGISQALVTTVLGLIVAIPTLLLHNLVNSKATKITQIIEQEAVALIAMRSESPA
ncbi:energy transducer TonB [Alteromonas sediminis]|uniref:Energy transducer TonB n=1 Tax=Alteromonas sediminis TaxID=2259342 RepID=A0A3N5YAL9_9ALTE|nr:MotA/TolQ/ExbB proton channel family protein [Alteromonas sediminis]RPJ65855.1 energy transducer TonB [Alteromonas sediminis]